MTPHVKTPTGQGCDLGLSPRMHTKVGEEQQLNKAVL